MKHLIQQVGPDCIIEKYGDNLLLVISFSFAFWGQECQFDFCGRLKKLRKVYGCQFNVIYLRDPNTLWYQSGINGLGGSIDEVVVRLKALIEELKPSRVITLGQSMGGYAAMLFGGLLAVDRIIAFAPLSFLVADELKIFGDERYYSALKGVADIAEPHHLDLMTLFSRLKNKIDIHIVFGSRSSKHQQSVSLDSMHALRLQAIEGCTVHAYPDADHLIVKYLSEQKKIDGLLLQLIFDRELIAQQDLTVADGWKKWIFNQLLSGFDLATLESEIKKSDLGSDAVIAELRSVAASPYIQAAKAMKLQLDKRNWLLDVCDQLSRLNSHELSEVEKREVPTFQIFVDEYYSVHRPVVLTNGFDHWPAREKWNPDYFAQVVGEKEVEVQFGRAQDNQYERNSPRYKKRIPMRDFCRLVVEGGYVE
ncbi:cupin-like domain-containing protein [Marinagarivorans algicola]|uniref:cupin-like domain-containing protein n=1 Tax=Marinagarivorans algicola TaxID=1513270 RepID=UPI0006B42156|nr:cupin-like domain-containing protein [Marinagarivorans algicola]